MLVTFIEAYEDVHYPITLPSKAEVLEYFRETRGTSDEEELEQLWLNMKNDWDYKEGE